MRAFLICFLSLMPFFAFAQQTDKEISCNFVQTKKSAMFAEEMVSTGKMYFCPPDKVRWEYLTPVNTIFIMNGEQALVVAAGKKKKVDIAKNGLYRSIADIMTAGTNPEDDRYEVEKKGNVLNMKPLRNDMKRMFSSVTITFGPHDFPVSVIISEKNGDSTELEFTDIKTGDIDMSVFEY